MTRISTLDLNSLPLGSALGVQSQYAQAETQQASGLVASDFGTLGGASASEMLNLEGGIAQSQTWASDATTVGTRTQGMYTSLGNMIGTINQLQTKISGATSTADNSTLMAAVQELQDTLVTEMNTQQEGNYLFAGSNVLQAPVDLTNYPSSTFNAASPDTSYYTGDDNILSVRISQQQTVNYGVTANGAGFEEALRATQAVMQAAGSTIVTGTVTAASPNAATGVGASTFTINGGATVTVNPADSLSTIAASINAAAGSTGVSAKVVASGSAYALQISSGNINSGITFNVASGTPLTDLGVADTTYGESFQAGMKVALTVANSAVTDLANQQASVSAISSELNNAQQQQTTYVTYLQNSLSGVKDVDTAQVAAKVSQYQTQLQASYLAVAQISKVSLVQYL
jgi:flagellar hook-associated protein 3 FlgL